MANNVPSCLQTMSRAGRRPQPKEVPMDPFIPVTSNEIYTVFLRMNNYQEMYEAQKNQICADINSASQGGDGNAMLQQRLDLVGNQERKFTTIVYDITRLLSEDDQALYREQFLEGQKTSEIAYHRKEQPAAISRKITEIINRLIQNSSYTALEEAVN